jgi:hypothetical protein
MIWNGTVQEVDEKDLQHALTLLFVHELCSAEAEYFIAARRRRRSSVTISA